MKLRFNYPPRSSGQFGVTANGTRYVFDLEHDMTLGGIPQADAEIMLARGAGQHFTLLDAEDGPAEQDGDADSFDAMDRDALAAYALEKYNHHFHHNAGEAKMRAKLRELQAAGE
jgi:hypothetical protein